MADWGDATDEDVLAGVGRGDETALGALYDRYGRRAHGLAYRVLGERGAAEEAVQEAFMSIWRRADSFAPGRGSAERWILTIAHNRAIDRLRARAGRVRTEAPLDAFASVLQSDDPWHDVDRLLRRDELERWLAELPAAQRQALEMAYFDGYLQHEIAAMTDVPLGTVKARTRAALKRLRERPAIAMGLHAHAAPSPQGPPTERS